MTELGFLDTTALEETIDKWLRSRVISIPEAQERLLFSDLDPTKVPPLRIIAKEIDGQVPIVFSRARRGPQSCGSMWSNLAGLVEELTERRSL